MKLQTKITWLFFMAHSVATNKKIFNIQDYSVNYTRLQTIYVLHVSCSPL